MFKPLAIATTVAIGLSMGSGTALAAPHSAAKLAQSALATSSADIINIHHSQRRYHKSRDRYSPRQIRRILRHRGFHDVRILEVGRKRVLVRAHGRRGPVRLVVSRRTGEVLKRQRLGHHRHYYKRHKHGYHGHYRHRDHGYRYHDRRNGVTFSFGFSN